MTSVQELKPMIAALSSEDLDELARFIAERRADQWDAQIEADAKTGRLDSFFARTLANYRAGKTRPLDEVLSAGDTPADAVQP